MAGYELTQAADGDVQDIARYTVQTWGAKQALRYGIVSKDTCWPSPRSPERAAYSCRIGPSYESRDVNITMSFI